MDNRFQNDENEIIDVAYQTATDDEFFAKSQPRQPASALEQESEDAMLDLALDVMRDPERCFCRNCGQPVYKNASVCVHCNYVINPTALRQGQRLVRARRDQYESSKITKVHRFIRNLTGIDLEPEQQKQRWAVRQQQYHYQTSGEVYCSNCGCVVDPGASVCVNCNYVLNPEAVRRARLALSDKQAKFTKKDRLRCLLLPGVGFKMHKQFKLRRPQVAKPALLTGLINTGSLAAVGGLLALWFSQFI